MKTFSILGCGWLGYALAQSLTDSYLLKVSTSSIEKKRSLEKEGFCSYLINDEFNDNSFYDCDILLINIPPSKSKDYLALLTNIYKSIQRKTKVIFISSTSIYDKSEKEFYENEEQLLSFNSLVYKAEKQINKRTNLIFRCAGLMGYTRIAGKYFSNKLLDCEDQLVNYVHRDDVISAIIFGIDKELEGIYNLCSPIHPSKKKIYLNNAEKYGFDKPIFKDKKSYVIRVINSKLLINKGFEYKYKNPLGFI
jgi:nucleoside-diphosphate-sugar epimerase